MSPSDGRTSHEELIQNYLENEATPQEEERFRFLLRDELFRRRAADYAIDLGHLHDLARQGMLESRVTREPGRALRSNWRVAATAAVAVSLLLAFGAWFVFHGSERLRAAWQPVVAQRGEGQAKPVVIARLADVTARVRTAESPDSKEFHEAITGDELRLGEVLQTVGEESFAVLKFKDNSVLAVAGDTELRCLDDNSGTRVVVACGDIMAQIRPQPAGKPLVIETRVARAEVVGTKLSLFADLVLTELAVLEGRVRFQRLSDNRAIDVNEGERAVASTNSQFMAEPIGAVPTVWEEDFEEEWPKPWRTGHWIHYGLPPGSTGAAKAASRNGDGGPCFIASPHDWMHGLFRVEENTHLNMTYKVKNPGWFCVMLSTRPEDFSLAYRGSYIYQSPELWNVDSGQWRTVSIPLRSFRDPQRGRRDDTLGTPTVDDVVISLFLRIQNPDAELFVDRIWVTKGPAEGAELLESP